jgi:hypothetical protein
MSAALAHCQRGLVATMRHLVYTPPRFFFRVGQNIGKMRTTLDNDRSVCRIDLRERSHAWAHQNPSAELTRIGLPGTGVKNARVTSCSSDSVRSQTVMNSTVRRILHPDHHCRADRRREGFARPLCRTRSSQPAHYFLPFAPYEKRKRERQARGLQARRARSDSSSLPSCRTSPSSASH